MFSFRGDDPKANPYVTTLSALVAEHVDVVPFAWRGLLFQRVDVFHVHWPEALLASRTWYGRIAKRALLLLVIARSACSRFTIVRTMHNIAPHESGHGRVHRWLLVMLDRQTKVSFVLNRSSGFVSDTKRVVVLHPDYRNIAPFEPRKTSKSVGIVFFGQLRKYKGVEYLIDAFRDLKKHDVGVTLTVVGECNDSDFARYLSTAIDETAGASLDMRYLSQEELNEVVRKADLIVLPYRNIENSGSALFALSVGRPLLIRGTPATFELQQEVGKEWVRYFSGDLDTIDLQEAVCWSVGPRSGMPVFDENRSWAFTVEQTVDVYNSASRRRFKKLGLMHGSI